MRKTLMFLKMVLQWIVRMELTPERKECTLKEVNEHIKLCTQLKAAEIEKLKHETIQNYLKEKEKNG